MSGRTNSNSGHENMCREFKSNFCQSSVSRIDEIAPLSRSSPTGPSATTSASSLVPNPVAGRLCHSKLRVNQLTFLYQLAIGYNEFLVLMVSVEYFDHTGVRALRTSFSVFWSNIVLLSSLEISPSQSRTVPSALFYSATNSLERNSLSYLPNGRTKETPFHESSSALSSSFAALRISR